MKTARPSDFSSIVRESFAFLTDDLGYALVEDEWDQPSASWIVRYERPDRAVNLVLGCKDAQFYFRVLRTTNEGPARRNEFYVFQLMYHIEPERKWVEDLDIRTASPSLELLRERIEANADALRSHGWSILSVEEWFDSSTDRRAE